MIRKCTITRVAAGVALALCAGYAKAQVQLEEIVVTAQKRAESLQDVPISITALDGSKIEEAGINNLEDLTAYVPNLMLNETAVATSIVMRGVGPGNNQSFEQSVGLYVDGVHLGKGRQARTGLFDIERVEVLRGPQGILFGKNTLAGAINVTSATPNPGDELSGKISASVESFSGKVIEGNLNGSVNDSLALRLAFKTRENDGYLDNSFDGSVIGDESPSLDETLLRFAAHWQPNDNLSVKLKHAEGDIQRVGATSVVTEADPVENLTPASQLAFGVIGAVFPQIIENATSGTLDSFRDGDVIGGVDLARSIGQNPSLLRAEGTDTQNSDTSINIEYDFGNGYTLNSVTGYSEYEYADGIDADFLPIRFIGRYDFSEYEHKSQEFRVSSDSSNRFSFIAGAFYQEQVQEVDKIVAFDGTLGIPGVLNSLIGFPTLLFIPPETTTALGLPFGVNGLTSFNEVGRVSNWKQETDAWAVFFQGEYDITDNLRLTAGLRYTEEEKRATKFLRLTADATGLATYNPNPLLGAIHRSLTPDAYDHDYVDSRKTDQLMPGASLEWTVNDDHLFYVSYAEGFKSGGFNSVDDQAPNLAVDNGPIYTIPGEGWVYGDETANSLEIGGKHTLFGGGMNLNWAIFSSEYDDQQVSTFSGVGFVVRNAASSEVNGVEVDWRWQATENLFIGANAAYLDATYGSFPAAGCTALQQSGVAGLRAASPNAPRLQFGNCISRIEIDGNIVQNQNLAGLQLPQAPEYSGSIYFDYEKTLGDSLSFFLGGDINFSDSYFLEGDLDPIDKQDAFEKINLRGGFRTDAWEVMFYGRNITDEETASGGFDVPLLTGAHASYTDEGTVYGAKITYRF